MAIIIDSGKRMTVAAAKAQGLPFPVGLHDESVFTVGLHDGPQRPASSAPARHTPPEAAKPAAPRTEVRAGGFGAPVAPTPAAKKTVKHKLTKHHEEETTIVDDAEDDDEDDRDDEDPDEEDEDDVRAAVDTAPVRAALAAQGRAHAARSEDRRIRPLRAQRSLEQQSEAERHAARVIAAARGETEGPRFASLEEIERARQPAPVGRRGGRIIDGKYVVGA